MGELEKENLVSNSPKPKIVEIEIPEMKKVKRNYTPRKTKTTTKKVESAIGENEISSLLVGTFSLIALKGGDQWVITTDEAEQISKPLSNILKKIDVLDKVSNVSDGVMLCMALGMILIPRVLITVATKKEEKKDGKSVRHKGTDIDRQNELNNSGGGEVPTNDTFTNSSVYNPGI